MLKPALNLAARITASETAKPREVPDTAISYTRKAGPIEYTHPRNKALPKSDRQSNKEPGHQSETTLGLIHIDRLLRSLTPIVMRAKSRASS